MALRLMASGLMVMAFIVVLCFPSKSLAYPYGGQIYLIHFCYNSVVFAGTNNIVVGAPRPTDLIWTGATRTYQFGPPRHVGQWHLGLTGPPYFCIVTLSPIYVKPGISIMMMGSSQ